MNSNRLFERKLGQIISIFFIEASSATAFAVFYSGLSLYLTKQALFTKNLSTLITGLFLSMNYLLPLLGGLLANRTISYKKLYLLGNSVSIIGCLLLAHTHYMFFGLSCALMSSLVTNVCLNMFITQLFTEDEKKARRVAFIWNYVGMNVGFMIGFLLTGFSNLSNNFNNLFTIMSIFLFISVLLTLNFIKEPKLIKTIKHTNMMQLIATSLIILLLIALVTVLFHFVNRLHSTITILSIVAMVGLLQYTYSKTDKHYRYNFRKFIIFSIMAIVFWTVYMLTPLAMMQIIEHNVERNLFGIYLAPQWFVNIDSIFILIVVPSFTFIAKKYSMDNIFAMNISSYFSLGFFCEICGILILMLGISFPIDDIRISTWPILGYLILLTFGEIFISPIGNSLIGELIDEPMRGLMTGVWSMNIAIGGLLSSVIANQFILPHFNANEPISDMHIQRFLLVTGCFLLILVVFNHGISRVRFNITEKS